MYIQFLLFIFIYEGFFILWYERGFILFEILNNDFFDNVRDGLMLLGMFIKRMIDL